ncbi:hypothetical protein [Methanosarcina sp. 1.H.T.1A.1]|uniref:hypothetical protein n=1 Tax=Methanosarcina sp. 1.H.T.1A.1 TaxID=1483602 RepID=UPI001F19F72D|nr:hypothetical protein [Methanosarcina sp. 1.H.T.1A.1]
MTSFSGCTENKVSAAEEINTSSSLIYSADLRVESAISDMDEGSYTSAKNNLKAARVDYEEALKILNNASSDYEEETKDIERDVIFAEAGLDAVSYSENLILATEHLDKFVAHLDSEDIDLSRKELDKASEALNNSIVYLGSAKEKIFSIDLDSVPVEQKSYVTVQREDLETSEKMSLELRQMINGLYPFLDGSEHLFKAGEYLETEEWDKAADEIADSSVKLSESKESLETLKDSDYSEISVGVIEICGILTQLEKDLPHLEAGCRYMEKGRYSQAEAEFSKVSDYY